MKIIFKRKDWNIETKETISAPCVANKTWMICKEDGRLIQDRHTQLQIKDILSKQFTSVKFLSPTSVYFYFTEEAEEAEFVFIRSHDNLDVPINRVESEWDR